MTWAVPTSGTGEIIKESQKRIQRREYMRLYYKVAMVFLILATIVGILGGQYVSGGLVSLEWAAYLVVGVLVIVGGGLWFVARSVATEVPRKEPLWREPLVQADNWNMGIKDSEGPHES